MDSETPPIPLQHTTPKEADSAPLLAVIGLRLIPLEYVSSFTAHLLSQLQTHYARLQYFIKYVKTIS